MLKEITSKDNPTYKQACKVKNLKYANECLIEGEKIINEALQNGLKIKLIFVQDPNWQAKNPELFQIFKNQNNHFQIAYLSKTLFKELSANDHPREFICWIQREQKDFTIPNKGKVLILDSIQNPGNLGTIIRTALGIGFQQIVLNNCVQLMNSKVVQASMGAAFQKNVYQTKNIDGLMQELKENDYKIFATNLGKNSRDFRAIQWSNFDKLALIIGNEGHGIQNTILRQADYQIKIPMLNNIESLNVAVATGILCYFIISSK